MKKSFKDDELHKIIIVRIFFQGNVLTVIYDIIDRRLESRAV